MTFNNEGIRGAVEVSDQIISQIGRFNIVWISIKIGFGDGTGVVSLTNEIETYCVRMREKRS